MRRVWLGAGVAFLFAPAITSSAQESSSPPRGSPVLAEPLPFATDDAGIARRWRQGHALELEGRYLESARVYEELAGRLPAVSHIAWRIARNHYLAAKALPLHERAGRLELFQLTEDWANRGIEADARCAECALYKFIGMSRRATTQGIFSSARNAKRMARLLDRAFELSPSHVDNDWNSELANLYYAAGVFYRSVPESSMLRWTIGVKGDIDRSIELLRKANAISNNRIDYHIELGAALQCAGIRRRQDALTIEGKQVLDRIPALPDFQPSDAVDRKHALVLVERPDQSCKYSREAWIEKEPN